MPEAQLQEFEALMASLATGSEDAAWQLTERYTPHIIRAVRATLPAKLRRLLDSQDFAQAVWASLLTRRIELGRIETEPALKAYLAKTAKNKVVDACRQHLASQKRGLGREQSLSQIPLGQDGRNRVGRRLTEQHEPVSSAGTPSAYAILRERWRAILATESEQTRRIIELRMQGDSYATIAAQLGIHHGSARRSVRKVVEKLSQ